jgi:hypothetical protein
MLVLFALLNPLLTALQKIVTFRAEQPQFVSKPHRNRTLKATLWGFVGPDVGAALLPSSVVCGLP